jgi:8-oxo-dGTP pyrophosphatase MutT (NUDIX family)
MDKKAIPLHAATVVLLREKNHSQYEIFLMRRRQNSSFARGAFVFPGGRLDETDCREDIFPYIVGLSPTDANILLQEPDLPPSTALGLFIAAIRETFEEAGILPAYETSGDIFYLTGQDALEAYQALRFKVHKKQISMKRLAEKLGIRYALDLLLPYSHWITPEIEKRRFDTRFFLMRMPVGQHAVHDRMELTDSQWMTPAAALAEHYAGRIFLMPPTLKTIEELNTYTAIGTLWEAAKSRDIRTILPEFFKEGSEMGVKLPHDPEYTISAYKQPARRGETSRIVIENGGWKSVCIEKKELKRP